MPEDGNEDGMVEGLTVQLTKEGELRLAKQFSTKSFRYIDTLAAPADEG